MKLSFRQGILRRQTDISGSPTFLVKSSLSGDYIDLVVSPDPTIITFAHGQSNYLIDESKTVHHAWGPFPATGQTQYLFWDISLLDGTLTRGYTLYPLLVTPTTPVNPQYSLRSDGVQDGQHWFDPSTVQMKMWNGNKWLSKLRVFAATYNSSAIIVPFPMGTQGNLNVPAEAGNIVLAKGNKPLRNSDGEFITTESTLIVGRSGSSTFQSPNRPSTAEPFNGEALKINAAVNYAQATETIPKYSLVSMVGPRKIALASHLNVNRLVSGLIQEDLYEGEIGPIISGGLIRNEFWNWNPLTDIGSLVFCGANGEITLTPPTTGISQPVGEIQDVDAIFINIQTATIL